MRTTKRTRAGDGSAISTDPARRHLSIVPNNAPLMDADAARQEAWEVIADAYDKALATPGLDNEDRGDLLRCRRLVYEVAGRSAVQTLAAMSPLAGGPPEPSDPPTDPEGRRQIMRSERGVNRLGIPIPVQRPLRDAGILTIDHLRHRVANGSIDAVRGLGPSRLETLREALARWDCGRLTEGGAR